MTSLTGETVLVTGAGGFIGSHLVEALVRGGARTKAYVRYTSRADIGLLSDLPQDVLADIEVVRGDLRDPSCVASAMTEVSVVFHLAALVGIPYSYAHPRDVAEVNVMGTMNMLDAAASSPSLNAFVHTSTSEVFGSARTKPMSESHPLQAQSPYAASKIAADKLAESFHKCFGLPVAIVRPFNTYGPRQSARAIVPTIVTQALSGSIVRVGSVWPTRDLTFVSDTVEGFLAAASCADAVGRDVNLGTGEMHSIREVIETVGEILEKDLEIVEDRARVRPDQSEVAELMSDNSLARDLLGWRPRVILREGLLTTIDWLSRHLDRYRVGVYET